MSNYFLSCTLTPIMSNQFRTLTAQLLENATIPCFVAAYTGQNGTGITPTKLR